MNKHTAAVLALLLSAASLTAAAADGLVAPPAETLWPQWQARVSVQAEGLSRMSAGRLLESGSTPRNLLGGAVLGDYYFAAGWLNGLRASGGLMVGALGGAPLGSAAAGPRLDLSVSAGHAAGVNGTTDTTSTVPYLGLGYTGAAWRNGPAITADIGLVAAGGVGRALFGNQGMEGSLRELRLSPLLQVGVRYAF